MVFHILNIFFIVLVILRYVFISMVPETSFTNPKEMSVSALFPHSLSVSLSTF